MEIPKGPRGEASGVLHRFLGSSWLSSPPGDRKEFGQRNKEASYTWSPDRRLQFVVLADRGHVFDRARSFSWVTAFWKKNKVS